MEKPYQKTGYLNSDFRVFYLTSAEARDFQSHYHDFHKLLIFISGSVSYYIEGETYQLKPWDMVSVPAGQVHRPLIHSQMPYHRMIFYVSPAFFEEYRNPGLRLDQCFSRCSDHGSHVLRLNNFTESRLYRLFSELAGTAGRTGPGDYLPMSQAAKDLYQRSLLLQFFILLTSLYEGGDMYLPEPVSANEQVLKVLSFVSQHLQEDLSIDRIADNCYLNRSYLMHLFRRETGYTLGTYITEKRLFAARALIQSGMSVTEACLQSGFSGYSSFYRAYRKKFGAPPKNDAPPKRPL